jgi:hypothetical protein
MSHRGLEAQEREEAEMLVKRHRGETNGLTAAYAVDGAGFF